MLRTDLAKYEVVGRQNNHLWLEVLNSDDQGVRVSVPVRHRDYDDDLQRKVLQLDVGDIIELTLESDNESPPDWRIEKIEEVNSHSPVQVVA